MIHAIRGGRGGRARLFSAVAAAALLLSMQPSWAENLSYTYDELGRLKTVTYQSGTVITYTYDPAGNRTQLITSGAPNQPPTAVNDTTTTPQGVAKTFDPRTNDTDPESNPLTITAKTNGSKGTVVINSGASVTYTPTAGQTGADSFTYTISDGQGGTSTATVSVTITPVNQPPTAVNDTTTTPQGVAKTFDPRTNDTDPESNPLTITAKTNGSKGTVAINSGVSVTYTPTAGQTGADSFTYTISDGQGGTSTATVSVTITPVNQPPTAVNDTTTTPQGVAKTFDPRTNDTDPESNPLTITAKTNGSKGTVVINSGASVTYTPTAGQTGADSFTYTISDGQGGTSTATVSVTITPVNQPPTAVNDTTTTPQGVAKTFDPRTNDTDPESNPLTITAKTNGSKGTVVINSGASVTYTPTAGQTGADSFTYTISDGQGGTSTATVSVTITTANQPPTATDDNIIAPSGFPYWFDPRTNDTDPESNPLTITAKTNGAHGVVGIVSGKLTYSPTSGYLGPDSFTYTISDGNGGTDTATVTVSVHSSSIEEFSFQDVTAGPAGKTTFVTSTVATFNPGVWIGVVGFDPSEYTSVSPTSGTRTYSYEVVEKPVSGGTETVIASGTFDIISDEEEGVEIEESQFDIEAQTAGAGLVEVKLRVWRNGSDGGIEGLAGYLVLFSAPEF